MRSFFSLLFVLLLSLGLVCSQAYAKRFGGGRSFGVQRSYHSYNKPSSSFVGRQANKNTNRWGGLLGGLLIGGLLGTLLMGNGIASGLMTWLILGILVFLLFNFMRRKKEGLNFNTAKAYQFGNQTGFNSDKSSFAQNISFDNEQFTREAKLLFIRLQTAYDNKNLNDIKDFTSPEVFAEISLQLQEEPDNNHTEIEQLNLSVLDAPGLANANTASVHFTGRVKENGIDTPLNEVWHFRKAFGEQKWIIYGVQQN